MSDCFSDRHKIHKALYSSADGVVDKDACVVVGAMAASFPAKASGTARRVANHPPYELNKKGHSHSSLTLQVNNSTDAIASEEVGAEQHVG